MPVIDIKSFIQIRITWIELNMIISCFLNKD